MILLNAFHANGRAVNTGFCSQGIVLFARNAEAIK